MPTVTTVPPAAAQPSTVGDTEGCPVQSKTTSAEWSGAVVPTTSKPNVAAASARRPTGSLRVTDEAPATRAQVLTSSPIGPLRSRGRGARAGRWPRRTARTATAAGSTTAARRRSSEAGRAKR